MEEVLLKFLNDLKLRIPKKFFKEVFLSHPDYPSLLSIADTFERFGIDYSAFRINKEEVNDLSYPYLLLLKGETIPIKSQSDLQKNSEKLKHWDGTVLQIDDSSVEREKVMYKKEKSMDMILYLLIFSGTVLFLLSSIYASFSPTIALIVTSMIGAIVGFLLLAKDFGFKNNTVESFCNAGKNINCDKILKSDAAKLFGVISFSDIVVTYFTFHLFIYFTSIILPDGISSYLPALFLMGLLSAPVVIFSLYYQNYKAKTWCRLCLIIDALLVIQLIVLCFIYYANGFQFGFDSLLPTAIALLLFLLLGSSVILIKSKIAEVNTVVSKLAISNRIKFSTDVFTHLLFQQKKIDGSAFNPEILIGDPNAPVRIIMVSNLYCNPCKEQHVKIAQLVDTYPDKVAVAIRFVQNGQDSNHPDLSATRYIIKYWLYNIHNRKDESSNTEKLLENWYRTMDLKKFMEDNPVEPGEMNSSKDLEERHYQWHKMVGISSTPSFFINGYELPKNYSIEDMMTLTPGLVEYFLKVEVTETVVANYTN